MQNKHTKKEVAARWGVHELDIRSIMEKYPEDFNEVELDPENGYIFTKQEMERFGCFVKNETGVSWRSRIMKFFGASCLALLFSGCGSRPYSNVESSLSDIIYKTHGEYPIEIEIRKFPENKISTFNDSCSKLVLIAKIRMSNSFDKNYSIPAVVAFYNHRWYFMNSYSRTYFKGNPYFENDVMHEPLQYTPIEIEDWIYDRTKSIPDIKIVNRFLYKPSFLRNSEWQSPEVVNFETHLSAYYFNDVEGQDWKVLGKYKDNVYLQHKDGKTIKVRSRLDIMANDSYEKGLDLYISDREMDFIRTGKDPYKENFK